MLKVIIIIISIIFIFTVRQMSEKLGYTASKEDDPNGQVTKTKVIGDIKGKID